MSWNPLADSLKDLLMGVLRHRIGQHRVLVGASDGVRSGDTTAQRIRARASGFDGVRVGEFGASTLGGGSGTFDYYIGPNEPSGMTTLFSDPMEQLPLVGTPGPGPGRWVYDDPPVSGHDATLVTGAYTAWEIPYLTSLPGGSEPFRAFTGVTISPQTERMLYDCVIFKYSANWDNSTNVATKFSYFRNGGTTNHYWTARWGSGSGIALSFSTQGAGPTVDYEGRPGVDVIPDDTWARVEILRTCNNPAGTANGSFQMWYSTWTGSAWTTPVEALFNKNYTGSYISRVGEVLWAATGTPTTWDYLAWTGVYGGGGASPPANMNLQIAHWYASAK